MSYNYEQELKSTRSTALAAAQEIDKVMRRFAQKAQPDAQKYQVQFSLTVLNNICSAVNSTEVNNSDICCDILERTLEPHMLPELNAIKWTRTLEYVRYIHYQMINAKRYEEAERVLNIFNNQKNLLQSAADYKILLNIYCQHIFMQRTLLQTTQGQAQITLALQRINFLLEHIKSSHSTQKLQYKDLLTDFLNTLMPKRSTTAFQLLSAVPATKETFKQFFLLLSSLQLQTTDVQQAAEMYMEALFTLMQFDMQNKLQLQLALQHLNVCCDLFKPELDTHASQLFQLLHDYFKCVYLPAKDISSSYVLICDKFVSFFDKSAENLLSHNWFLNALLILQTLLTHTQHYPSTETPFMEFWQQLSHIDAYAAHFKFILGCIKLATGIKQNSLVNWTCCTSTRKHVIIALSSCSLSTYSAFLKYVNASSHDLLEKVQNLQRSLLTIVRHALQVIHVMSCMTAESQELKVFFARFMQLTRDVSNTTQAYFCILSLAKELHKLREKVTAGDWLILLRRLYKTAAFTKDTKVIAEMTSCYLGHMLQQQATPDINLLFNQIGVYYATNNSIMHLKCLLKYLAECQHVLKPDLPLEKLRLLYWLEAQYISRYERNNATLQASLLSCAKTPHDYIYLVFACKMYTEKVLCEVQSMRKSVSAHKSLTRLQHLVLAQATSILLISETDIEKRKVANFTNADCKEQNLEMLMERAEMQAINLENELRVINLAVEALQNYEAFYKQADLEFIAHDVAFIDWELIVDDLRYVALFLQYSGYHELATQAWLLLYRISSTIMDSYTQLRCLAYFCEHAEYFVDLLDLQQEIQLLLPPLSHALQVLPELQRRQQNAVLIAYCQLAYYYAREGSCNIAQMLLDLVQKKQAELPDRQGKYDIVLGTVDMVRFRISWKLLGDNQAHVMQKCAMQILELLLKRLRDFAIISSGDALAYLIMIFNLTQETAECTANRVCENLFASYYPNGLKMALQTGSTLRVIQVLTAWMWGNLQAEHVKKAQTKLQIIECVLGIKNWQQLMLENKKVVNEVPLLNLNSEVEALRRVGMQQQEINTTFYNEIQDLPETARNCDLLRFFKWQGEHKYPHTEIFEWVYFNVGCLNARLYYLIGEHTQLLEYYENGQTWLQQHQQKHMYLSNCYQNVELLLLQHYANYLHATRKYESAQKLVKKALKRCQETHKIVDLVYSINFNLQLQNIATSMQQQSAAKPALRRALEFNISPTDNVKTAMHKELPFTIYTGEDQPKSVRKVKQAKEKCNTKTAQAKITTKRTLYTATPKTTDSTCSSEELQSSSENELVADLNACQIIDLDTSEESTESPKVIAKPAKVTVEKAVKKVKDKELNYLSASRALKPQQKSVELPARVTRANSKLTDTQTPTTRGRTRKINKLENDENVQPVAVLKTTTTTRRRRLN